MKRFMIFFKTYFPNLFANTFAIMKLLSIVYVKNDFKMCYKYFAILPKVYRTYYWSIVMPGLYTIFVFILYVIDI